MAVSGTESRHVWSIYCKKEQNPQYVPRENDSATKFCTVSICTRRTATGPHSVIMKFILFPVARELGISGVAA